MRTEEAEALPAFQPVRTKKKAVGGAVRAVAGLGLVAFIVASANAVLLSQSQLVDARLPMLGLGLLMSAPGWLVIVLAARARRAPGRWLAIAGAWGLFAAPLLALIGEDRLSPLAAAIVSGLAHLGADLAGMGASTLIGPLAEEPSKALGAVIVLVAVRRAGIALTLALGAAVGALTGLGFSLMEISHRMGVAVGDAGYYDLNNVFVVDWDGLWRMGLLQLVNRMFIFGLSDHAIFTALAGVAIVLALRGRWVAAGMSFAASLVAHGLSNSAGVLAGNWLYTTVIEAAGGPRAAFATMLAAAWSAAVLGFLVSQAWAVLLLRRLTRENFAAPPSGEAAGSVMPL